MMKKILLYGGAFNPPTRAHTAIFSACLRYAQQNSMEFWLLPSGPRPDKSIVLDPELRLQLIRAALTDLGIVDSVKVLELELRQLGLTESYLTIEKLRSQYPDKKFIWVFGSDSIETMKEWGGGERIFLNQQMLIIQRRGHVITEVPPNAVLVDVETPDISSTSVRQLARLGRSFDQWVTPSVAKLIQREGLYNYAANTEVLRANA